MRDTSVCVDCTKSFVVSDDEHAFHKRMGVPSPKRCPRCRFIRRLVERNARTLYRRTCDLTGEEFISPYHRHHPFPVYKPEAWWSDEWDGLSYGRPVDFSRPFFPQFLELLERVPHQGQFVIGGTMQNSDYVNCAGYLKDCYLIAETDHNESCLYGNRIFYSTGLMDCSNCYRCEYCYEAVDCIQCYGVRFCEECHNCSNSAFLKNCIGCRDCIACINLRQKRYCISNEQYTPEEYEKKKATYALYTRSGIERMRSEADAFFLTQPQKAVQNEHIEESSGNHLYDSKNAHECFDCKDLEDCRFCARVFKAKSSLDYTAWGDGSELMYQCAACGDQSYHLRFCTTCTTNNRDLTYCAHMAMSHDCFGCAGLKRKEHCILNVAYGRKEYEELSLKLQRHMEETGEWGEYFPKDLCPFGYNETIAMEYFPMEKEEAIQAGYDWCDEEEPMKAVTVIGASDLPESIAEVPDTVLQKAIACRESEKPFRVIRQEMAMLRDADLPLPQFHPTVRHRHRMARRSGSTLYERNCAKCGKAMETSYPPERREIVYCEECYLETVY